jgi:hypothetical protein
VTGMTSTRSTPSFAYPSMLHTKPSGSRSGRRRRGWSCGSLPGHVPRPRSGGPGCRASPPATEAAADVDDPGRDDRRRHGWLEPCCCTCCCTPLNPGRRRADSRQRTRPWPTHPLVKAPFVAVSNERARRCLVSGHRGQVSQDIQDTYGAPSPGVSGHRRNPTQASGRSAT